MIFFLKIFDDGASLTRRRRFMNWSIVISIEPGIDLGRKTAVQPADYTDYQAITDKSLITQSVEIQTIGF
ncbi:MAG: hypothetical protein WAW35_11935 [Sideroxyarcus sp.]